MSKSIVLEQELFTKTRTNTHRPGVLGSPEEYFTNVTISLFDDDTFEFSTQKIHKSAAPALRRLFPGRQGYSITTYVRGCIDELDPDLQDAIRHGDEKRLIELYRTMTKTQ